MPVERPYLANLFDSVPDVDEATTRLIDFVMRNAFVIFTTYCLFVPIFFIVSSRRKKGMEAKKRPRWSGQRRVPPLNEWARQVNDEEEKERLANPEKNDRKKIPCWNPGNMETLCEEVPSMSKSEVEHRVRVSREVQQSEWRHTSFGERRRVLGVLLDRILLHKHEICVASSMDSGKPLMDAYLGEILTSCEKIRWLVNNGEQHLLPEKRSSPLLLMSKKCYVEYKPVGVVGMIVPWNYPFHNILGPIVVAMFTGNAAVIKVSEWVTWSLVHVYERIFHDVLSECGYNPDLLQFLVGYGDTGQSLINSGVNHMFFIGSPATGKHVMRAAADTLTPVTLELGGKDPFIVCEDCNFDRTLAYMLRGILVNAGQSCLASERIFVHGKIYNRFVAATVDQVRQMRTFPTWVPESGNSQIPSDKVNDIGAITMSNQIKRILTLIEDAVKHGAKVEIGGKKMPDKGQLMEPTVLSGVTQDMKIAREEVFGPVILCLRWNDDDDVIRMANDTPFGLGSYVFSRNIKRAENIANRIHSGVTMTNDYGLFYVIQDLPFGGVKNSGFGKFNGREGLRAFCHTKAVVYERFDGWLSFPVPRFLTYPVPGNAHIVMNHVVEVIYSSSSIAHRLLHLGSLLKQILFAREIPTSVLPSELSYRIHDDKED